MRIPTKKWGKLLLSFVLISLISGLIASRQALTSRAASSAQSDVKEDLVSQMIEAEANIAKLKQVLAANQKDTSFRDQLNAALSQYDQLSAQMGGDRAPAVGKGAISLPRSAPLGGIGIVPTPPTGCNATTSTVTQSTPVAIPTGPAVVTSTVVVAGAGAYLWDLNLQTFLTHTFAADLDITLQSPAGTVVTLTTDNGAGNDNVFNGTVWDDQANPGGQVPYVTNNGLVTDHAYVNLTTATPLVPEEAMGAFIGENPNGTWTITISDDLAGDGGSLDSWTLEFTTFPVAPTSTTSSFTQNTPVAIPTGPAVVTSTLVVSGAGTSLCDVTLTTNLTHTFAADLDITLQSPAGTVVTLTTDNGAGNDNVFNGTLWSDKANPGGQVPYVTNPGLVTDHPYVNLTTATPLVPEEAMAAFAGEDPNGTWTITISDDLAGDGGSLDSWTLNVTTCSFLCTIAITCPANVITAAAQTCPLSTSTVVTFPAPTVSSDCGGATTVCNPPSGSTFPLGTTTVTCTATDACGNTDSCTFTVSAFSACLQDDSVPTNVVFFSPTGDYLFCCNGVMVSGTGLATVRGCIVSIQHNPPDRRVLLTFDGAVHRGTASLQMPPGTIKCTIIDRNTLNNTCTCQ
jgi:subtilisin-like proprotein convertase family protein